MSEELKALKKQLLKDDRNGYDVLSAADLEKMEAYCTVYKAFLDAGKTERLSARAAIALAEKHGFVEYKRGMSLSAGDKVYSCNRGKGLVLAVVGRRSLAEGAQITAAHIDSPRLDLKPTPLYEDSELAYFKTHYYGGVRKYQWVTIPLELRGTVVLRDGSVVDVCIGEGDEPKLVITDLLPHLGAEQSKKPLSEAIPGETLNILLGSRPLGDDDDSDRVKMQVLKRLYDKYGITEADFASAELETVPAVNATDIGLDGSLIGAYGHDDRVCGFAALQAILDIGTPEKTAVCVLADKEEIGSMGVTGMQSAAFDTFMNDLCESQNVARPPTSPPPTTPTSPMCMKSATPPSSTTAWACASTPGPGASPVPPMPTPKPWAMSAACWIRPVSAGRSARWARSTPAAAVRWPSTWPTAISPHWTPACRC